MSKNTKSKTNIKEKSVEEDKQQEISTPIIEENLSSNQLCNRLGFNKQDKFLLEKKYGMRVLPVSEWMELLNEDFILKKYVK